MTSSRAIWIATAILVVSLAWLAAPVGDEVARAAAAWRGGGVTAVVLYALLTVGATLLLAPASALAILGGYLWGPVWGFVIVHGVAVVADYLPFAIARRVGRIRLLGAGFLRAHCVTFESIDRLVESGGVWFICLVRWCPVIPFNVANYALGLTSVRTRDYLLASIFGCIPNTAVFVFGGAALTSPNLDSGHTGSVWSLVVVSALCFVGLGWHARKVMEPRWSKS